jgi:hypothetical protein
VLQELKALRSRVQQLEASASESAPTPPSAVVVNPAPADEPTRVDPSVAEAQAYEQMYARAKVLDAQLDREPEDSPWVQSIAGLTQRAMLESDL